GGDAPPGGDLADDADGGVDVRAEGDGHQHEAVAQVVEADADLLGGRVDQRTDVHVGGERVAAQHLDGDGAQLVDRVGKLHVQKPGVEAHALEVLTQPENIE